MTITNIYQAGQTRQDEPTMQELIIGFRDLRANLDFNAGLSTKEHERQHLLQALQAAVTLEFATLPPYLAAIWSFRDEQHPMAASLRLVVQEEMLHMALACNMMVALGGSPQINTAVPAYPGQLPFGVHPNLTVGLSGFGQPALETFLEIERPNHPGHHLSLQAAGDIQQANPGENGDFTIGEFYDHVLAAFQSQDPVFRTDRQITGPLMGRIIQNLDDVAWAIHTIQHQGEGSDGPPDTGPGDLAHYYRFAEMYELKKLELNHKTQQYEFVTPIDFDPETDLWPMAPVPVGGYPDEAVPNPEARRLLLEFNQTYSHLLDLLQGAWQSPAGEANVWHGIDTMFELERTAKALMQIPLENRIGNYGPDFRYLKGS